MIPDATSNIISQNFHVLIFVPFCHHTLSPLAFQTFPQQSVRSIVSVRRNEHNGCQPAISTDCYVESFFVVIEWFDSNKTSTRCYVIIPINCKTKPNQTKPNLTKADQNKSNQKHPSKIKPKHTKSQQDKPKQKSHRQSYSDLWPGSETCGPYGSFKDHVKQNFYYFNLRQKTTFQLFPSI